MVPHTAESIARPSVRLPRVRPLKSRHPSTPQDNVALLHQYTIILYVFGDLADEMEFQAEACGDELLSRIEIDLRGVFPGNDIDVGPCTHAHLSCFEHKKFANLLGLKKTQV